ncbi:MAG: hypothetical protein R2865_06840 [Deinococcales bacterium]
MRTSFDRCRASFVQVDFETLRSLSAEEATDKLLEATEQAYDAREAELGEG